MPYPKLDRGQLVLKKLSKRKNKVDIERDQVPVTQKTSPFFSDRTVTSDKDDR